MTGTGLPALQVPSASSHQQPSSASAQPLTDTKLKSHTQHPQHHSIGAASVLSPKGSMTNPVSTLVMSKDQKLKYDLHQGSLNAKKQIKGNQAYDDLRYKLQQQP